MFIVLKSIMSKIINGILLLDKPEGITSNRAIQEIKHRFRLRKIGHGGTLDPIATGLLIVLINKATRLAEFAIGLDKTYLVEAILGKLTDTLDREGSIIEENNHSILPETIEKVISEFPCEYNQRPPKYSAKKIKGKEAYKLAREGKDPDLSPQRVRIYQLELLYYAWPVLRLKARVSSGTYIRSLILDIARRAGSIGYVNQLRRVSIGRFTVNEALTLDKVISMEIDELKRYILPMEELLYTLPSIELNKKQSIGFMRGRDLKILAKDGRYKVLHCNRFIGIADIANGKIISRKVFE